MEWLTSLLKRKKVLEHYVKLSHNDIFNLISCVGKSLNSNLGKPIKGRFVESCISRTINDCKHVDQEGYDLLVGDSYKIEVKSLQHCLFTKGGKGKEKTSKITIKNIRGKGEMTIADICSKFHELILVDTGSEKSYCIATISSESLLKPEVADWFESKDGRQVQIITKYMEYYCFPADITIDKSKIEFYNTEATKIITDIQLNLLKENMPYVNVDQVCGHIQRNWRIPSGNQESTS